MKNYSHPFVAGARFHFNAYHKINLYDYFRIIILEGQIVVNLMHVIFMYLPEFVSFIF